MKKLSQQVTLIDDTLNENTEEKNVISEDIVDNESINKNSFSEEIINEENWGLRELSYSINKFKKAFYNFFQIEASGQIVKDLNRELNQSENLIRYIFIRVKEHQELPTKLNYEKK